LSSTHDGRWLVTRDDMRLGVGARLPSDSRTRSVLLESVMAARKQPAVQALLDQTVSDVRTVVARR
jgi:hypothetical protein